MFDPRNNLANEVSAQLIMHFGDKVFRTIIPRNIRLAEAPSFGKPVLFHDKESRGALAYLALAGEMIRREEDERHARRGTPGAAAPRTRTRRAATPGRSRPAAPARNPGARRRCTIPAAGAAGYDPPPERPERSDRPDRWRPHRTSRRWPRPPPRLPRDSCRPMPREGS